MSISIAVTPPVATVVNISAVLPLILSETPTLAEVVFKLAGVDLYVIVAPSLLATTSSTLEVSSVVLLLVEFVTTERVELVSERLSDLVSNSEVLLEVEIEVEAEVDAEVDMEAEVEADSDTDVLAETDEDKDSDRD